MSDRRQQESPPKHGPPFWAVGAVIVVVILWGLSVVLPVWETRSDQYGNWAVVSGFLPALIGWLGVLVLCPAWLANLLLILLCIAVFKCQGEGFWLSAVTFAVAASAYMMPGIYWDNDTDVIVGRRVGFYLWLGSFLLIALTHALLANAPQRRWTVARWTTVALMVLSIVVLEGVCPVGVSPLETSLKDPNDQTAFLNALARKPPQAERDAALLWAMRQDLWARLGGPSQRVEKLVAAGANVNQADRLGKTVLMEALDRRGTESLVGLLVRAGADVNARDYYGRAVLDIAREAQSSPQCQQMLVDAGARAGVKKN